MRQIGRSAMRIAAAAGLIGALAIMGMGAPFRALDVHASVVQASGGCNLGNGIQHVIDIQFDNVHLTRDNPNVPSDLEQMPHLLNFIEGNGVMISHEHTPLIAHTADDIVTSLTGLYPDQQGLNVANSFRYYNADGTTTSNSAFVYWTDKLNGSADKSYVLVGKDGKNAPAPWVPYTRAGCNVGAAGMADMELENTSSDVANVFGSNPPDVGDTSAQKTADLEGLAIHCAQASSICSSANGGVQDNLPDESGGYNGYMALFGNKFIQPVISPGGPVTDLFGNVITYDNKYNGFPGFDPTAAQSLAYVADMQEHGVPVTYAYIADAHDNHATDNAYGPGEAGYVATLKSYDQAFADFFQRLAADGITRNNTLFVITADENDHFVGGPPSPANCDGVTVPCTYSQIGEIDTNLPALLAAQGNTTPFAVHEDSAPPFYITGNPAPADPTTRSLEQTVGRLTAVSPYTNQAEPLTNYLADPAELDLLHMVTGDQYRTPSFVLFGNPNNYFCMGESWCGQTPTDTSLDSAAWNHGDVAPDINTTWLGMVGPGIRSSGLDSSTWSSESDIRPTMMTLLGLHDDYSPEGRPLIEIMDPNVLPHDTEAHHATWLQLAQTYEQLNSPVGALALASLQASTRALESTSPNDSTYTSIENQLKTLGAQRDGLASQIEPELNGQTLNEQIAKGQIAQANALIAQAKSLANS